MSSQKASTPRVAVVTGTSSGIGEAVVKHFYEQGHQVLAVDFNAATVDVVEAQQKINERRFACTRATDQTNFFSGFDGQIKCLKYRVALVIGALIGKVHIIECYLAMVCA